jgi:hypothetical protein
VPLGTPLAVPHAPPVAAAAAATLDQYPAAADDPDHAAQWISIPPSGGSDLGRR